MDAEANNPSRVAQEIAEEEKKRRARLRQDSDLMYQLLAHPGWPRFLSMIEAVAQNFNNTVQQPLDNVLMVTKLEYAKGALKGLSLAAQLPRAKINEAKAEFGQQDEGAEGADAED